MTIFPRVPDVYWQCQGTAEGYTELNAFDGALLAAGIGDTNLLKISSIVPPAGQRVDPNGAALRRAGAYRLRGAGLVRAGRIDRRRRRLRGSARPKTGGPDHGVPRVRLAGQGRGGARP